MVAFIEWRDNWLLDIADVDDEHRELVELVNRLAKHHCRRLARDGDGSHHAERMFDLMERLGNHVRVHFRNEEQCMLTAGYPGYDKHCYEHVTLLAEYAELMREVRRRGVECVDEMTLSSLKLWLIGHIAGADRRFGEYYRDMVMGAQNPRGDLFTRKWIRSAVGE